MMRGVIFTLIFLLLCGIVVSTDRVEQLEALVHSLKEEMVELKVRLDAKQQCECNLTEIEHDIRQNGIKIAKLRHTVVLNREHISENLDKINQNQIEVENTIGSVKTDLESMNNVQMELEASIDQVNSTLQDAIESVDLDLQDTVADLADTKTKLEVRLCCSKV